MHAVAPAVTFLNFQGLGSIGTLAHLSLPLELESMHAICAIPTLHMHAICAIPTLDC